MGRMLEGIDLRSPARPDFKRYLMYKEWGANDAIWLLNSQDPNEMMRIWHNFFQSDFSDFDDPIFRKEQIDFNYDSSDEITEKSRVYISEYFETHKLMLNCGMNVNKAAPIDYINWACEVNIDVPPELKNWLHSRSSDKWSIGDKEVELLSASECRVANCLYSSKLKGFPEQKLAQIKSKIGNTSVSKFSELMYNKRKPALFIQVKLGVYKIHPEAKPI